MPGAKKEDATSALTEPIAKWMYKQLQFQVLGFLIGEGI